MNSFPQRKEIDPVQLDILEMLPLSRKQKDALIMLLLSEQEVITGQRTERSGVVNNFDTQEQPA